jgi:peptidoglycan biosynthesis protein MviN/MurJ (putative lipid II flippase)
MVGAVLAVRYWVGDWTQLHWGMRLVWLLVAVAAGGAAYAAGLLLTGLRPAHLREPADAG